MYKKILVPLDGSDLAECVLLHVESIAGGCGTENVTFVRVVEPFYMAMTADPDMGYTFSAKEWQQLEAEAKSAANIYLKKLTEKLKYNKSVKVQYEVLYGKAADAIADYADKNNFDLITIATHGRSGVSRWVWGSVADRVLRSACTPILMVRAPGCGTVS